MEISIKDKKYNLEYASVIGVNYTYETEFGTTLVDDTQKLSEASVHVRIAWAILKTDNDVVECTFNDFRKSLDDRKWMEIFGFIQRRTEELKPALQPEEGGDGKND